MRLLRGGVEHRVIAALGFALAQIVHPRPVAPRAPVTPRLAAAADWLQFGFDSSHSGVNPGEIAIDRSSVAGLQRRFRVALPGIADGAPALSGGRLYLTLEDGTVVCVDARTGDICWTTSAPAGPQYTTSSPALDPDAGLVYAYGLDGFAHRYRMSDGSEVTGGGWPQLATLKPDVEKGSSALTIFTGRDGVRRLAVTHGGYPGDAGDYQGHVTVVDLSTGRQRVFNAACSSQAVHFVADGSPDCDTVQTAVWARCGVVYDASTDRLYFATGNGVFDGSSGGDHWGDSVLAIAADGTGGPRGPLDSYTPVEFQQLQDEDLDLGSTAPAFLPAVDGVPRAVLQAGKDAQLRLLAADDLSGRGGPGHVGGELASIPVPQGGEVLTALAVARDGAGRSVAYVADDLGISAVWLRRGTGATPELIALWQTSPGGSSPIVVNGIVFHASSGRLWARDASTGEPIWSDEIGPIHWASPIAAGGAVYIADGDGMLTAYSIGGR